MSGVEGFHWYVVEVDMTFPWFLCVWCGGFHWYVVEAGMTFPWFLCVWCGGFHWYVVEAGLGHRSNTAINLMT